LAGGRSLEEDIGALKAAARTTGIFSDFDGSLAPIVEDPEKARPIRGAGRVLERLARRYASVVVVSGRPVSFLSRRLHPRRVRLVGLYGIEERVGRSLRILPEVRNARSAVDRAAQRLRDELNDLGGVWVEHKGLAVSVHFRRASEPEAAMRAAETTIDRIATEEGLGRLMRGRLVFEIGPAVSVDKGDVVRRLIAEKQLSGAFVAGDDVGDIPIFDAVKDLDLKVRIAVSSSEAPPELLSSADHVVSGPGELLRLLKSLTDVPPL
jgi:trehalose 6-phosphate phosphatase